MFIKDQNMKRISLLVLAAIFAGVVALPVQAQREVSSHTVAGPDYRSDTATGLLSSFSSPEADGRPGIKDFMEAMTAYHRGDYKHAVYMLKVAASWAYEPAEYNLGVMYFQGIGVPVNRPLGTAWMFLAAERNAPDYVDARHMMVESLDDSERSKALEFLHELQPTYGDKVALHRAKAQWAWVKDNQTGTRVGGAVGELRVGINASSGVSHPTSTGEGGPTSSHVSSWLGVLTGGSVDGAMAYQQLHESNNPYSAMFLRNRSGVVTVEPLQNVTSGKSGKFGEDGEKSTQPGSSAGSQ